MIPKSIKISSKTPPRTDHKNDSKHTSKLVPLDPQELSSRCSGGLIFTKTVGSENLLKITPQMEANMVQTAVQKGIMKSASSEAVGDAPKLRP